VGSLKASAKGLQTTMELLESHYHHGSLTFKDIRQVILQVRHWQVCNIYRPLNPVEIQLLDVGFMSNEKFIALENCSNMFQYETVFSPPSLSPRCTGNTKILMGESGHIMYVMQLQSFVTDSQHFDRHRFYSPQFAEVRRRTTYKKVANYNMAWKFFIAHCEQFYDTHHEKYPELHVSDLILGMSNFLYM
jgi:hypothetical protein